MLGIMDIMQQAEKMAPMMQQVAKDFQDMKSTLTRIESKLDLVLMEQNEKERKDDNIRLLENRSNGTK